MLYVDAAAECLAAQVAKLSDFFVYGQNVAAGSRLGGLASKLEPSANLTIANTPNSENALVGMGFGMMLAGSGCMYMMKQSDFLLLGIDHLVNTWKALQEREIKTPFVICVVVVDSGWEGPQSNFNNLMSLFELSGIPVHLATGRYEMERAVDGAFQGGPSILAFSQRLMRTPILDIEPDEERDQNAGTAVYEYKVQKSSAKQVVIEARNFSLPYAIQVATWLQDQGIACRIKNKYRLHSSNHEENEPDTLTITIDDSKIYTQRIASEISRELQSFPTIHLRRPIDATWIRPSADVLSWNSDELKSMLLDCQISSSE